MRRLPVQRGAALDKPLSAVPADRDAQPSAFGKEDNATIEVRTLPLLQLARRWRDAARQSARQPHLGSISANSDVVPIPGEMPAILEVFCGLQGGRPAAVLLPGCCDQRSSGRQGIGAGLRRGGWPSRYLWQCIRAVLGCLAGRYGSLLLAPDYTKEHH